MRHPSHFRSSCAPIFTALLLTVLLSPPPTRCATVSTPPPNATVLKLGVILPFTNVHFVDPLNYSNAYFETMQLAIDMISATSLLPADAYIQLDPRDSQDMVREGMSNALDLAKDGAIGLVGDITSGVTIGPALATGYLQIPICGSTATASDFDNKEKYPFFFRTIPSDQMHATAFLRIFQYYNWAQTAMMYDNSDYAKGIVTMFSALAAANDIRVLSIEQYYPKYYRPAIKSIAESKARIIIWVGNREDDLVDILPVARDAGLLAREYVWLAVEAALWAPAQMEPPDYHLLDGFIVSGSGVCLCSSTTVSGPSRTSGAPSWTPKPLSPQSQPETTPRT
ncbi:periplasmic binding protein-like I [Fimicolochytrium jonesii]|uniref:periplasmic binding protein-like I n=1 Tax=Fimicolochytrium jonesii TaxID=1396493 RepID=UPI0022FE774F|nr:periplasmic binding protein-like I [Fimicolochytrium jonesii]KAI8822654.1 periplasmic binding protein-like I [Fimicolochytrium jonesii]